MCLIKSSICFILSVLLFKSDVESACYDQADACFAEFGNYTHDISYSHDSGVKVNIRSPETWEQFCKESVEKGLGTCMMNALSYCVIDTPDQAYVLDLMNSYNFRCEQNNLEVYSDNYQCFQTKEFENGWMDCYATQAQETDVIYQAMLTSWDLIQIQQLMNEYCLTYNKYLMCVYTSSKLSCSEVMAQYMYHQEVQPVKHTLTSVMGCNISEDISNLTLCDVNTARKCISDASSDISGLSTRGDMTLLCSEINDVESMLHKCMELNLYGCDNATKNLFEYGELPEVREKLQTVNDLCALPPEPTEGECDYRSLDFCKNTVLAALDIDMKQLCQLRFSFIANFTKCLDNHLLKCPSTTKNQFRELEAQILELWTTSDFNQTCELESDCVGEVVEKLEKITDCVPNMYADYTTFEAICQSNQDTMTCIEELLGGCEPIINLLEQTGFFDSITDSITFYGCTVTMFGRPMTPSNYACNYRNVLKCYSNFFQLIGMNVTDGLPLLHNLSNMFLEVVNTTQDTFCSNINTPILRQCLDRTLPQCGNLSHQLTGHQLNSDSYKHVVYDQDKILTYNIVQDAEDVCEGVCNNVKMKMENIRRGCQLQHSTIYDIYDNIAYWQYIYSYYNVTQLQIACSDLSAYTECVSAQGGECPFIRHHFLDYDKFFAPAVTRGDILVHCNMNFTSVCKKSYDQCMDPIASGISLPKVSTTTVTTYVALKSDMENLVSRNADENCKKLSTFDVEERKRCLNMKASSCIYGDVYIDPYVDTLHAVADIVQGMCGPECLSLEKRKREITIGCETQPGSRPLTEITLAIRDSLLYGEVNTRDCRMLELMASCIAYNVGQCNYLQEYAEQRFFGSKMTAEAMLACSTEYAVYTGSYTTARSATQSPRTGAASHIKTSLQSVIIMAFISSLHVMVTN